MDAISTPKSFRRRNTLTRRQSHLESMSAAQQFEHSMSFQSTIDAIKEPAQLAPVATADIRDSSAPNLNVAKLMLKKRFPKERRSSTLRQEQTPSVLAVPDQEAARDWSRRDGLHEINAPVEADNAEKMKKPGLKKGRMRTSSILPDPGNANEMAAALEADAAEKTREAKSERRTVITTAADFFAVQARMDDSGAEIVPWSRPSLAHCDIGIDTCDGADAARKNDVMHHLGLVHKPAQPATMSKPKHKSTKAHKIAMMKRMGEKRLSMCSNGSDPDDGGVASPFASQDMGATEAAAAAAACEAEKPESLVVGARRFPAERSSRRQASPDLAKWSHPEFGAAH